MASELIQIGAIQLEALARKVRAAADADLDELLDNIGQQQEDSARRRILQTKAAPDGKKWKSWSKNYAKTRGSQHSLLRDTGALVDSMTHQVDLSDQAVLVGSNMVYAARHLFGDSGFIGPVRGGGRMPARPFLDTDGRFSDSHDREEIRDIVRDFLGGVLQ